MARFTGRWRPLMMAALAAVLVVAFTGWRPGTASANTAPEFTAVEIADGVLFNEGVAAKYLGELHRYPMVWTEELRNIQKHIHERLQADEKCGEKGCEDWRCEEKTCEEKRCEEKACEVKRCEEQACEEKRASRFVELMQSGDPQKVSLGMRGLGVVAREVLDNLYGQSKVDEMVDWVDRDWSGEKLYKIAAKDYAFALDSGADWYVDTEYVLYAWVAAAVALVLVVVAIDFTPRVFSDRTLLAHEIMVQGIAQGLRAY
ncbi:hypothetical protein [Micromonospora sp. NBC_01638]|uniref:hypothetical protein n=1 Tax=Micromonospora sp. NBC_01638 TaxID=2975982 RepID=UPI00386B5FB5|nr:hypothetical protein OG811_12655 [Micromonospora sp. NBC_01638]